jgi:hypothetical protein
MRHIVAEQLKAKIARRPTRATPLKGDDFSHFKHVMREEVLTAVKICMEVKNLLKAWVEDPSLITVRTMRAGRVYQNCIFI